MPDDYKEFDSLLENEIVERHSYFQMKYFIVGKEPTTQAKMWRCLRELKARRETLSVIDREIEEAKDQIGLAQIELTKIRKAEAKLGEPRLGEEIHVRKELEIKVRQTKRKIDAANENQIGLTKKKQFAAEEAEFFAAAFKSLVAKEPLKAFDDLDEQTKYWDARLSEELGMKLTLHQPLDLELVRTILALDNNTPIKQQTSLLLGNSQKQIMEARTQSEKQ